jgi:hypothetical protein
MAGSVKVPFALDLIETEANSVESKPVDVNCRAVGRKDQDANRNRIEQHLLFGEEIQGHETRALTCTHR